MNGPHKNSGFSNPQTPTASPANWNDIVFFDSNKNIPENLFFTIAEKAAEKIHQSSNRTKNSRTQIRKFYDEVQHYRDLSMRDETEFKKNLAFIKMIYAKAVYSQGREHVTADFTSLMKKCIEQTNSREALNVFATFFEAFMGFYRKY